MTNDTDVERAADLLQQLGLKQYEAKCFVALTRLPSGTAKEISEVSAVPRTRVYDATRVLESKGLIEVQHASPQRFRAVSIDAAVDLLRAEYEAQASALRETLDGLAPAGTDEGEDVTHEVWALSGGRTITSRAATLVDDAVDEAMLVVGHESVVDEALLDRLGAASDRGVDVVVGASTEGVRERVGDALPGATTFVSELGWLRGSAFEGDVTEISRLLLVDRSVILVSTFHTDAGDGRRDERAVFGRGFDNGVVTIARRLMATGLVPVGDSGESPTASDGAASPSGSASADESGEGDADGDGPDPG